MISEQPPEPHCHNGHLLSRRMWSWRIRASPYLMCCRSSAAPRRCARLRFTRAAFIDRI
jgi:hypothetical protein